MPCLALAAVLTALFLPIKTRGGDAAAPAFASRSRCVRVAFGVMSAPAPSLAEWVGAPRLPARPVSGFLPTKAPISLESVDSTLDEGDRYEVSMFMDRQTSQSRSVGLCVDTTVPHGGARLFEAAEWDDYDVQCVQLRYVLGIIASNLYGMHARHDMPIELSGTS